MLQTMVFSKKMGGALADVPLFGTAFNNWFPVVVLFWCGALFLNIWQGIARFILRARFQLQESGSNERLERGQVRVRREQGCWVARCLVLNPFVQLKLPMYSCAATPMGCFRINVRRHCCQILLM